DRIAMKRLGQVEDVAEMVAFLASYKASYITGHVICVDGGMSV
ncbi:MAG: SDR family oxidoreductase, partial [Lachnospiraceae bacterium]|nr:SDR family oxidoreductase [Lachnospiraceae bacterium]